MKKLIALMLALLAAWPACALAEKENVDLFAEALSETCHVQEGHFEHMDTIALASQGKLISCFGNNAGSGYLVPMIPPAPNQEPAPATEMGQAPDLRRSPLRFMILPPRTRPPIPISALWAGRISCARMRRWCLWARCRPRASTFP